jgi:hypothetical protein
MKSHQSFWFVLLISLVFMLWSVDAQAQGGSNYSVFGLGDTRQTLGSAFDGLGGTMYAVPSDYLINSANPATWSLVKSTRVQTGYRFNQAFTTEGDSRTGQNNGKLDGAAALFALDTGLAISATIGVFPSSSINYLFTRNESIKLPDGTVINGLTQYQGVGGMVTAYLGGSTRISGELYGGLSALIHFGRITDTVQTTITSEESFASLNIRSDRLSGIGLRGGLMWQPSENLWIGGSVTINSTLNYNRTIRYLTLFGNSSSSDTTFPSVGTSTMPFIVGAGASYISGRFLFTGDLELQNSADATYRISSGGSYANGTRFGVGISRMGTKATGSAYFDKVGVNVGAGMRSLTMAFGGNQVSEVYGSFGLQMPFGGAAMIDISVMAGVRSATGFVSENFFRIGAAISVGETWFIPFRTQQ